MVLNASVLAVILLVWVLVLTGWIVYRELVFRRFFKNTKEGDVRSLLDGVLGSVSETNGKVDNLIVALESVRKSDLYHIQKLGLVRFNPFKDAGGNQSFALSLLNEENTGIILTGLHARETTRIYIKDVAKGRPKSELSVEEKQSIEIAVGKK